MKFHVVTIFPKILDSYLHESLFKRAIAKKIITVQVHDLRVFSDDARRRVDDRPYGGGPGMVMKVQPFAAAVARIKKSTLRSSSVSAKKTRVILFSTRGKVFDAAQARRLAKYDELIFLCGRYEGVDERVAQYVADEEISVGSYVLAGGEIPGLAVMEAVSRFLPGFLGKNESLEEVKGSYPVYTRPEVFTITDTEKRASKKQKKRKGTTSIVTIKKGKKNSQEWSVPGVLLSGDHKMIDGWRKK